MVLSAEDNIQQLQWQCPVEEANFLIQMNVLDYIRAGHLCCYFNDSDVIVASLAVVCTPSSRWSLRTVDKGTKRQHHQLCPYVHFVCTI